MLQKRGAVQFCISTTTGFDRKTVCKYLLNPRTPQYDTRGQRRSKLDAYKEYLDERLKLGVWNAVVLLDELRVRGYSGGHSILNEYISPRRRAALEVC